MEDCAVDCVPIVDFEAYSLEKEFPDPDQLQKLVDEVHHAFTTVGFVYLKNTGYPSKSITDAFDSSKAFFHLEKDVKLGYRRGDIIPDSNFGYIQTEQEGLNPERAHKDLKEAFNFVPHEVAQINEEMKKVPEVASMVEALQTFFDHGRTLHQRVLEIMARGLNLEDPYFFVKKHQYFGKPKGAATVRSLFYPAFKMGEVKSDQVRCGEHSDYGGITLLLQDKKGGLEVCNVKGHWIKAPPIEGTVLVNIGDLMQRWTSDKLMASKHRVMLPSTEEEITAGRQSIAIFGQPDRDEIIECIDGSGKYAPIGSQEYLDMRYSVTY